ncbi:hypothetical protein C8R45DRAFT_929933 [Mycena sanguinolenta]|nr:hypothetical protein C8R45DRAFT_929933 [Mycena sanguinolenta]
MMLGMRRKSDVKRVNNRLVAQQEQVRCSRVTRKYAVGTAAVVEKKGRQQEVSQRAAAAVGYKGVSPALPYASLIVGMWTAYGTRNQRIQLWCRVKSSMMTVGLAASEVGGAVGIARNGDSEFPEPEQAQGHQEAGRKCGDSKADCKPKSALGWILDLDTIERSEEREPAEGQQPRRASGGEEEGGLIGAGANVTCANQSTHLGGAVDATFAPSIVADRQGNSGRDNRVNTKHPCNEKAVISSTRKFQSSWGNVAHESHIIKNRGIAPAMIERFRGSHQDPIDLGSRSHFHRPSYTRESVRGGPDPPDR